MRDRSVGDTSPNSAARNLKRTPLPWAAILARRTESAERPEIVALVLLAVAHGLGSLAIDTGT